MSADLSRLLVVNGDDFGLTPGVNAGILDAHRHGILTSASLFANAPETERAIIIAKRTPTLGIGCHLALVDGVPVLPASQVPTLAPCGRFRPTWRSFIAAAIARRIDFDEIERELNAQIDRLRSAGLSLTHVDTHKHIHTYPPVFEIVARLARLAGIARVRVPCEPSPLAAVVRHAAASGPRRQAIENLALVPWASRDRRLLAQYGLDRAPALPGPRAHWLSHTARPARIDPEAAARRQRVDDASRLCGRRARSSADAAARATRQRSGNPDPSRDTRRGRTRRSGPDAPRRPSIPTGALHACLDTMTADSG